MGEIFVSEDGRVGLFGNRIGEMNVLAYFRTV